MVADEDFSTVVIICAVIDLSLDTSSVGEVIVEATTVVRFVVGTILVLMKLSSVVVSTDDPSTGVVRTVGFSEDGNTEVFMVLSEVVLSVCAV